MNKEKVYEDKLYCPRCKHVYQYRINECEVCSHPFHSSFLVDERFTELRTFTAIRSMEKYMANTKEIK